MNSRTQLVLIIISTLFSAQLAGAQVPSRVKYLHEDAFGSLVAVTDATGQVVWQGQPEPFGAVNTPGEVPRFLDKQMGAGGLHLLGARAYDPATGRFLTPDPQSLLDVDLSNPQRLNRYAYGLNNPYRYQDPSGEVPLETVLDIVDIGMSAYDLYNEPSWTNGGLLVWSVAATVVPYVPGAWVSKAGSAAETASDVAQKIKSVLPCNLCFAAGTLVHIAEGLKPIETIQAGDLVWAQDEVTGEISLRKVVQTFETPDRPLVEVELQSEDGSVEKLQVTPDHPFWVEGQGWTPLEQINFGARIPTLSSGWLRIGAATLVQTNATVFNFEVEEHHTYFAGTSGARVHNCDEKLVGHHAWPVYLGGAVDQALAYMPESLHKAFHTRLDQYLPRRWGTNFYDDLPDSAKSEALDILGKVTQEFDSDHGTRIFDFLVKAGFPLD